MKKKVWDITVKDNPNRVVMGENDDFYTTDTEAFLVFNLQDKFFMPQSAMITLENRTDGSLKSEEVEVVGGKIEWEMPERYIEHFGNWQVQIVYETKESGQIEKYTSGVMSFNVNSHIGDKKKPSLVEIENWEKFIRDGTELIETWENMEDLRQANEAQRQANYQELLDTGVLQTNINNKLEQLEEEYAPKLTEVTTQLAETERYVENEVNILSYEDSVKVPETFEGSSYHQFVGLVLTKFQVLKKTRINRIRFYLRQGNPNQLYELAIYDEELSLITTSEVRQIEEVDIGSWVEVAVPETKINNGIYYVGFMNRTEIGYLPHTELKAVPYSSLMLDTPFSSPLPNKIDEVYEYDYSPTFELVGDTLAEPEGFEYSESDIRVYGSTPNELWGWHTTRGLICKSTNSGESFEELMPVPVSLMSGQGLNDMLVINGRLYIQTSRGKILRTSDLTSDATWEDITAPSNLKRPHSWSRPYGMVHFNGYLFQGEYSHAPDELDGGPRILKYNVSNETWHLSGQFSNARHIHSFFTPGSSALWVSLGDAGYGSDIGIKRITSVNGDGLDDWVQWTSMEPPRTDHYPVDFIVNPSGIWMTSDRVGKHLLYSNLASVTAGRVNINALSFRQNSEPGETVRSLIFDNDRNAYYWTAETAEPALYVSPPPYTQSYKLKSYANSLVLNKSILSANGEYIFMFNQKIKTVKFPKKKVISSTPTIINRNYLYNDGFEKFQFEHNNVGKARKNEASLYLETSSSVGASSKATYYCEFDLTNANKVFAEYEFGFVSGTGISKVSVNNSSNADDIVKQVQTGAVGSSVRTYSLDVSELTGTKFLHFQAVSSQEASIQMRIRKIWVE